MYANVILYVSLRDVKDDKMSHAVIDFPFSFEDIDKVFQISEFLENKNELAESFKTEVSKLLVKKDFFKGAFRIKYNQAFDELISRLIKKEVTNHFPSWNPEEVLTLCETDFLKIIASDLFDPEFYKQTTLIKGIN